MSEPSNFDVPLYPDDAPPPPQPQRPAVARLTAIEALKRRAALLSLALIVTGSLSTAASAALWIGNVWAFPSILGVIVLIVGVLMGLGN